MTNILMLSHNEIPDARIEKEARALKEKGFKVFLVVPNIKNDKAKESFTKVFTFNYKLRHYFFGFLLNDAIRFHLRLIEKYQINFIHAHNILTMNIGLKLAKKTKLKLIYDDHETWSLWMNLRVKAGLFFKKFPRFLLYLRVKKIEKEAANNADYIIVTNRKCIDFYHQTYQIPKEKIIEIENIVLQSEIDEALSRHDLVNNFFLTDKRKKIVHVYNYPTKNIKQTNRDQLINRNFDRVIDAVEKLDGWVLVLFGKKNPLYEKRGVIFLEPLPRIAYLANIAKADIGLNPLAINNKTKISSQNRVFEYAKLGVRVISSKTELLYENFDEMFIWFNPEESTEKLISILKNIEKYPSGKKLQKFSQKFKWEIEVKKMIEVYQKLSN